MGNDETYLQTYPEEKGGTIRNLDIIFRVIKYFILHNNYCKDFIQKNNENNVPEENEGITSKTESSKNRFRRGK